MLVGPYGKIRRLPQMLLKKLPYFFCLKENDSTLPTDGVRVNWPLEEEGTSTLRDGYSDCQNDPGTGSRVSH